MLGGMREHGLETFSFPQGGLIMTGDKITLSKDGCYAGFGKFKKKVEIPQFTMPQEFTVVRLGTSRCRP
jgi:hypothetical protein